MPDAPAATAPAKKPIQFRLVHIFYAMAVLSSGLATFGVGGLPPALVVLAFWAYVFSSRSRPRALLNACLVAVVVGCLFSCLFPIQFTRENSRRAGCSNNLRQIALALQIYHDVYHEFPPVCITDKNGQPMHSWRVLILPFLEEKSLYDQYRFDEPWDGPNNRKLSSECPRVFKCPSEPRRGAGRTSYVAVMGPRTVWGVNRSRSLSEITDGTSNTVIVVEYRGDNIAWQEPRDLDLNAALRLFTAATPDEAGLHPGVSSFFFEYLHVRQVAFVDGSTASIAHDSPEHIWSELLTIDDGVSTAVRFRDGCAHLRLGNCFRLAVFILLTLWPLPWVWRKPERTET